MIYIPQAVFKFVYNIFQFVSIKGTHVQYGDMLSVHNLIWLRNACKTTTKKIKIRTFESYFVLDVDVILFSNKYKIHQLVEVDDLSRISELVNSN